MESKSKYYGDDFIGRWISGTLSQGEQDEFEEWLQLHPQSKLYFEQLEKIWKEVPQSPAEKDLSESTRWNRLAETLQLDQESGAKPMALPQHDAFWKKLSWRWVSAAAMLLIGLTSYLWVMKEAPMMMVNAPLGVRITAILPDSSQVILNAGSSIQYNVQQWLEKREVHLQGEAFFKVREGNLFSVKSGFVTTTVLGTSFNVKWRLNHIEVACMTGKVSIRSHQKAHGKIILTPGLASGVSHNMPPVSPYPCDIQKKTAWMSGEFYFQATPLIEVMEELQRQFQVTLLLKQDMQKLRFTGKLTDSDLFKALDIICLSSGLSYTSMNDSTISID